MLYFHWYKMLHNDISMTTWTTLGMATPQKPIPAPIDRFREKMAIEARACSRISFRSKHADWHFKDTKTHFLCPKIGKHKHIAKIIAFACLSPEAGISLVCHHRICWGINRPSLTTGQALLRHDWHLNWKRCRCVLCYLKTNRQCHLPMLDAGNWTTMCTHCYCRGIWNCETEKQHPRTHGDINIVNR